MDKRYHQAQLKIQNHINKAIDIAVTQGAIAAVHAERARIKEQLKDVALKDGTYVPEDVLGVIDFALALPAEKEL